MRHVRERAIETLLFLAAFSRSRSRLVLSACWSLSRQRSSSTCHCGCFSPIRNGRRCSTMVPTTASCRCSPHTVTTAIAARGRHSTGTVTAIYLSEYRRAPRARNRQTGSRRTHRGPDGSVRLLALLFVTPLLQKSCAGPFPASTCSAPDSSSVSMIIPYVSSVSEVMRSAPRADVSCARAPRHGRHAHANEPRRGRPVGVCPASRRPMYWASRALSARPWWSLLPPGCSRP